ncbi:MAG: hypothetical protein Q9222_007694, partial [Ikaeria aurantiellina]
MVAIKYIVPFLAALGAALPHTPSVHEDNALQARQVTTPDTAPAVLEKRVPPRSRIFWSPQGRMLFTIGLRISDEVQFSQIFAESSINIAKQLTYDFIDWIHAQHHAAAGFQYPFEKIGGVFSKDGEP